MEDTILLNSTSLSMRRQKVEPVLGIGQYTNLRLRPRTIKDESDADFSAGDLNIEAHAIETLSFLAANTALLPV